MKKYQVTWGWNPPQYDMPNGNFRLFYYSEEVIREVSHEDHETGEVRSETITEWLCDVVEYDKSEAAEILRLLKEDENSLECAKWLLKAKIEAYDTSRHVEDFSINGIHLWLKKDERTGLLLRFQAEKATGKTETVLWHEGMKFPLDIDMGIQMLYALEVYASETYDHTAMHNSEADNLSTKEEYDSYDYKQGYPAKLAF